MTTYVAGDVRNIQEFVFGSPRLREMRGASALIDFFDRMVVQNLIKDFQGRRVYSGGGNFLALFDHSADDKSAEEFQQAVMTAFLDLTGSTGLTMASHTTSEPFKSAVRTLSRKLEESKRQPNETWDFASMPFLKRCESCGRESADYPWPVPGAPAGALPQWLGFACSRKRRMHDALKRIQGGRAQQPVYSMPKGKDIDLVVPPVTELLRSAELPGDFHELVGEDDLAIVVADGNDLGRWFEGLNHDHHKELSRRIDAALRHALDSATEAVFEDDLRLQVLICGGDDLVVALPARYGMRFAQELLRNFRVKHPNPTRRWSPAGMAAGLLLCRPSFPFRQAHSLATALLGRAKARCRTEGLNNALAFYRVTATQVQSLDQELVAVERHDEEGNGWSYGAAGPYSLEDLDSLLGLRDRLRRVSASQRGRLREILSPRDDGPFTPLHQHWHVPARVMEELSRWLTRQEVKPFVLPEQEPPPELVRIEERRLADGTTYTYRRLILVDALILASLQEG